MLNQEQARGSPKGLTSLCSDSIPSLPSRSPSLQKSNNSTRFTKILRQVADSTCEIYMTKKSTSAHEKNTFNNSDYNPQIFMMMDFWPPISLGQHTLLFRTSNFTYTLTQNEEIQPKNSRAYADLRLVLRNVSKQGIESQSALRFYTQDSIPMFHHNSCMCFSISFLILTREETVLDSDAFYLVSSTCIK